MYPVSGTSGHCKCITFYYRSRQLGLSTAIVELVTSRKVTRHQAPCVKHVVQKTGSTWRIATPPEKDRAITATGNAQKFDKIRSVVLEICERINNHTLTDRQTNEHTHRNASRPSRGAK